MNDTCCGCVGAACASAVIDPCPHAMDPYVAPYHPAPIAVAFVEHASFEGRAYVHAFLDPGADCTLLGPKALEALKAATGYSEGVLIEWLVESSGQEYRACPNLKLSLDGGKHWIEPNGAIAYEADPSYWSLGEAKLIIGRDILHRYEFCCRGAQEFTLSLLPEAADSSAT